jgi:fatty-acyl-CoA synthase
MRSARRWHVIPPPTISENPVEKARTIALKRLVQYKPAQSKTRREAALQVKGTVGIRTSADIDEIEKRGLPAFLPHATPFALIEHAAKARPDHCALHYLADICDPVRNVRITYATLAGKIRQAANLFRRLGVGAEDSVAILMPHVPSGQIALWGAEVTGRACPINPMLRPDHIIALLTAARARIAVVLGNNPDMAIWNAVVPALREANCVTHILHADADSATADSDGCFEDLIAAENADRLDFAFAHSPDAIAACFHTGGTTGAPKLALHTHRNQAFVARSAALMYDLGPDDVVVNGFPLFHVAGAFVYGLSMLSAGSTLIVPSRLGMRNRSFMTSIWQQVEKYGVTAIGGVPTVISALNAVAVDADISSLRVMLTGGSPLPTELADAFERSTGKPVRNILGMTECAGVVTIEPFLSPRTAGSTGLRLPFTEVKVFHSSGSAVDTGSACNVGESGVVALRGPHVGPGYSDPARNAHTFEQGWLISGDLGHIDAEGRLFITGRAKDVIIRGSHNIDPSMIEDALLQHPDVAIAAAVGQPDCYAGELPVAFVTLKVGATVSGEQLRGYLEPIVEPAAVPKHVSILPDLPMTPIGKIYKPALRVLATRRAIELALAGAGLGRQEFEISASEADIIISVGNAACRETAKRALLGMPVQYEIRLASKVLP